VGVFKVFELLVVEAGHFAFDPMVDIGARDSSGPIEVSEETAPVEDASEIAADDAEARAARRPRIFGRRAIRAEVVDATDEVAGESVDVASEPVVEQIASEVAERPAADPLDAVAGDVDEETTEERPDVVVEESVVVDAVPDAVVASEAEPSRPSRLLGRRRAWPTFVPPVDEVAADELSAEVVDQPVVEATTLKVEETLHDVPFAADIFTSGIEGIAVDEVEPVVVKEAVSEIVADVPDVRVGPRRFRIFGRRASQPLVLDVNDEVAKAAHPLGRGL